MKDNAAQKKAPVVRGFFQTDENAKCGSRAINVLSIDRRVNNCRQHLLISMAHECRGMRFTADHRPARRQRGGVLGWAYFTAVGVPFDTVATPHFVAWCEPSFPKRTKRVDCMLKLVAELTAWTVQA